MGCVLVEYDACSGLAFFSFMLSGCALEDVAIFERSKIHPAY